MDNKLRLEKPSSPQSKCNTIEYLIVDSEGTLIKNV